MVVLVAAAAPGLSQQVPADDGAPDRQQSTGNATTAGTAPAESQEHEQEEWIDRLQRSVLATVSESAEWFDRFFGDKRLDEESDETYGRLALRPLWTQHEHFDVDTSFRTHVTLPNLDNRMHAFLGRLNEDEYLQGTQEGTESPDILRPADDESDWLLGFSYTPLRETKHRFSASVGVKTGFPMEPYVKGQYRRVHMLTDNQLIRYRHTVFWRRERGFGTTGILDLEHRLSELFLFRWSTSGTIHEKSEGVSWRMSTAVYQNLRDRRALLYEAWWKGETEAPVTVEEAGVRVLYRQQVWREWLFGEIGAIVHWPRDNPAENREASWGIQIGAEMFFGNRPRQRN